MWGWFLAFNLVMVGTFVAHIKLVGGEQLDAKADVDLHAYWKDWFPPGRTAEAAALAAQGSHRGDDGLSRRRRRTAAAR